MSMLSLFTSGSPTTSSILPNPSLGTKDEVPPAKAELKDGDAPMVKMGGVLVRAGTKPKGKPMRSRAGVSKKFKGASAKDGTTYNSTGRPAIWRVPSNNGVFKFVQSWEVQTFQTSSPSVSTFIGQNFTVNSLDQLSSLAAVFDQYKIELIEVWLTPRITTVTSQSASTNMGTFHTVIDYDDSAALSTIGQALDYTNVVATSGDVGHYRAFVPHVAVAAYSGTFTGFANEASPWIDAASTTVQHYGLKTAWTATDIGYVYDLVVRMHTAWRNVR